MKQVLEDTRTLSLGTKRKTGKSIMLSLQIQVHKAKHAENLPEMQINATNESTMDMHNQIK